MAILTVAGTNGGGTSGGGTNGGGTSGEGPATQTKVLNRTQVVNQ